MTVERYFEARTAVPAANANFVKWDDHLTEPKRRLEQRVNTPRCIPRRMYRRYCNRRYSKQKVPV